MTEPRQEEQFEMFEGASGAPLKVVKVKELERPLWTKNKAKLIERYLYYFVLVTKHGTYIDGFGRAAVTVERGHVGSQARA